MAGTVDLLASYLRGEKKDFRVLLLFPSETEQAIRELLQSRHFITANEYERLLALLVSLDAPSLIATSILALQQVSLCSDYILMTRLGDMLGKIIKVTPGLRRTIFESIEDIARKSTVGWHILCFALTQMDTVDEETIREFVRVFPIIAQEPCRRPPFWMALANFLEVNRCHITLAIGIAELLDFEPFSIKDNDFNEVVWKLKSDDIIALARWLNTSNVFHGMPQSKQGELVCRVAFAVVSSPYYGGKDSRPVVELLESLPSWVFSRREGKIVQQAIGILSANPRRIEQLINDELWKEW